MWYNVDVRVKCNIRFNDKINVRERDEKEHIFYDDGAFAAVGDWYARESVGG